MTQKNGLGYILINKKKTLISKSNLLKLIKTQKKKAILSVQNWDAQDFKDFQILVNGVFQAEGYAGGSFPFISKYNFNPTIKISQNASIPSIYFLCLLWVVLGQNLSFNIFKTSGNIYHISLFTRSWKIILKLIPYFSFVYGNKYRGLIMLKNIYLLMLNRNLTNETITKIIILGYNLVHLSMKRISLKEKIKAVLNEELDHKKLEILNNYKENNRPLSKLFLLGVILGDGNFSIRIRDTGNGLWFIPKFRIAQKNTLNNKILLDNMVNFLKALSIKSYITVGKKKENNRLLYLNIESIVHVKAFYILLSEHSKWFFWKKLQFSPLDKYFLLSNVASRHWTNGQLALLWEIYSNNAFPNMKKNYEFWKNKIEIYFKNKLEQATSTCSEGITKESLFYISISKDKSWVVTLPTGLNIKPKAKYFFFKTFEGSKEKALRAAIEYRDNSLNNWLINNGFKVSNKLSN